MCFYLVGFINCHIIYIPSQSIVIIFNNFVTQDYQVKYNYNGFELEVMCLIRFNCSKTVVASRMGETLRVRCHFYIIKRLHNYKIYAVFLSKIIYFY